MIAEAEPDPVAPEMPDTVPASAWGSKGFVAHSCLLDITFPSKI